MFGKNPIRRPVTHDGQTLDVQHIFPTIQGEGPFAGQPAVFVRLGGCNLQCSFCDTEFESFSEMPLNAIIARVDALAGWRTLVVITGGEPLRQPITPLCEKLLDGGYDVQIETNGTLFRDDLPAEVSIICSPKNPNGKYAPIRPDLMARAAAVKFVVSANLPGYGNVADVGQVEHGTAVYVQPMDEHDPAKNVANLELAKKLALTHGYHLSLQLHKIIGVE